MAETKILEKEDEDDRLSSLPDEVLTNILSFLPIHSAATTSVLSHRWRHLWTGVTRVQLVAGLISNSTDIIDHILPKLTSRKLHNFILDVNDLSNCQESNASVSWFREVCSRNVENILFTAQPRDVAGPFCIPAFLVNSQSLVTLNLCGLFEWPKFENISFHLPNLKVFILDGLDEDIPIWLETLIRSSPLLEVLDLVFYLFTYSDLSSNVLNIIAPNLKSLSISLEFCFLSLMQHPRVSIDAPKLLDLKIRDCISIYNFLMNPNTLLKACIDLKNYGDWLDLEDDEDDEENNVFLHRAQREYLVQMTKFVAGLSSINNLKLKVESPTNIFRYRSSVSLPIYYNLTRLETEGPMELLNYLRCFPNLEHLVVGLWSASSQASQLLRTLGFPMEQSYWSLPNSIPDCLVSKLQTIQLSEIQGTDDTLRLLAYLLSNANVLKKLCIHLRVNLKNNCEEAYTVWKECQFCRALFKLSKRSSTCEVVFSGNYVKASSNALQDGYLTCRMYVGNQT